MRIHIKTCGSHSITGALMVHVLEKNLNPTHVIVDIDEVLDRTDVNAELLAARKAFETRDFSIELGTILRDKHKERMAMT